MLKIVDKWAIQTGSETIDVEAATDYVLKNKLYDRPPVTQREQCMRDIRRALQAATHTDAQGNKVRSKHALRKVVGDQIDLPITIYVDPRTAKPDQMMDVFQQNWEGIANDVKRHAIEKQSYDLNNPYNVTLDLFNYDFAKVSEEAKMSGEYDDSSEQEPAPEPVKV